MSEFFNIYLDVANARKSHETCSYVPWNNVVVSRTYCINKNSIKMCDNTNTTTQSIADYLSQLLKDRKQLAAFPNVFIHVERLLDEGKN